MFSEDELAQARARSVLEIAEEHGAKLKKSGRELVGACPVCGGDDRFAIWPRQEHLALPRMRHGRRRYRPRNASQRKLVPRSGGSR